MNKVPDHELGKKVMCEEEGNFLYNDLMLLGEAPSRPCVACALRGKKTLEKNNCYLFLYMISLNYLKARGQVFHNGTAMP